MAGISTTVMNVEFPRYSTSEDLLQVSLDYAGSLGIETSLIRLNDLRFRACEGYYSKSAYACTWPCTITLVGRIAHGHPTPAAISDHVSHQFSEPTMIAGLPQMRSTWSRATIKHVTIAARRNLTSGEILQWERLAAFHREQGGGRKRRRRSRSDRAEDQIIGLHLSSCSDP